MAGSFQLKGVNWSGVEWGGVGWGGVGRPPRPLETMFAWLDHPDALIVHVLAQPH